MHVTTGRAGTVWRDVGRGPELFELTSTPMGDGTYVAEPLDRCHRRPFVRTVVCSVYVAHMRSANTR